MRKWLRIERSVYVCFFNIAIFPISFSNAKWIMEIIGKLNDWTLFIYKHLFGLFSRKAEINWTTKINASSILSPIANTYIPLFCLDLSTKLCQGLWFNGTRSVISKYVRKIILFVFLSSGDCNFTINYLKYKMRYGMWVHTCWTIWRYPRRNTSITFGIGGQNAMKKQ